MVEGVFDVYRKAVVRVVDLIGPVPEIARVYDPEHVVNKLAYAVLVGLVEDVHGVDVFSAFKVFKYISDYFVDLDFFY